MTRRSFIVMHVEAFREEVQEYTSAVIGEQTYRIWFRYWPGLPATHDDPPEDAEFEFLRAEREAFKAGVAHWELVSGPEQDWCMDWLDQFPNEAMDAGVEEWARLADEAANARREERSR